MTSTTDFIDLLQALSLALGYSAIGALLLWAGYFMWNALVPDHHLGDAIMGRDDQKPGTKQWVSRHKPSISAAILLGTGWLGNGLIAFWSIWNTTSGVTGAVTYCLAFGVLGILIQGASFVLMDLLTPGNLNRIIVEPGFHPYAIAVGGLNIAVALIVMAAITP